MQFQVGFATVRCLKIDDLLLFRCKLQRLAFWKIVYRLGGLLVTDLCSRLIGDADQFVSDDPGRLYVLIERILARCCP